MRTLSLDILIIGLMLFGFLAVVRPLLEFLNRLQAILPR